MGQPAPEGYAPQIVALEGDSEAQLALNQFVEGSREDPVSFQAAIEGLIQTPDVPPPANSVQAARHIVDHLLDTTDNGFNIDYEADPRFIRDVLQRDPQRQALHKELSLYEPNDRKPQLRALAARGLGLYIEYSR